MNIFKKNQIRAKWNDIFFKYHGIQKVFTHFSIDSLELTLMVNLLCAFSKNKSIRCMYAIIGGMDHNISETIKKLMLCLNCTENFDYKIIYKKEKVYVQLL